MAWLVALFGAAVLGLGALGVARPATLMRLVSHTLGGEHGIATAAAIRVALGTLLLIAADETRHPGAIRALGGLSLLSAALLPILGRARVEAFVAWWADRPPAFVRTWALAAVAFGAFLIHASRVAAAPG